MSYIDLIKEKAKADRKTIVLPETNDKRTLIAAARIMQEKIADIIMVGNEEKIMDGARWLELGYFNYRNKIPTGRTSYENCGHYSRIQSFSQRSLLSASAPEAKYSALPVA